MKTIFNYLSVLILTGMLISNNVLASGEFTEVVKGSSNEPATEGNAKSTKINPIIFNLDELIEESSLNSISPWVFPVHALDMVDSYMPFIFRTKKSAAIDELKVLININAKGKISGYEILNEEADKGLIERVGHVIRKLPQARPVPGFSDYSPILFELVIRK
ncbi:hypothetical protein [Cecembia rubra]|uniref:hypothetical protein n=1 Tax=Cecembia rubra TaxID=1485585 RepID=UPI0027150422|nr:hypothetical protein [Cecembia rubra]